LRGVIVFVKNPELGKVKTRLAETMGDEKALEIYNKLLGYTRDVLLELKDTRRYIYYSSFIDTSDNWSNDNFDKKLQIAGGLGDKMSLAFQETFEACDEVIIIGSDCPQLTSAHLEDAFLQLKTNDIVIGPSHDGGYYLLGMKTLYPELFEDMQWSTDTVFEETLRRVKSLELKVDELEMLSDIDYEEDWEKYGF